MTRLNSLSHPELGIIQVKHYAKRRSCAVCVKAQNGEILTILRLPYNDNSPLEAHLNFINENLQWIKSKRAEMAEKIVTHTFEFGDKFLYLGREYPLAHGINCGFDGEKFIVSTHSPALNKRELKKIYPAMAKKFIVPLCREYAAGFNLDVNEIRIKSMTSRWGSCSVRKNLNFAWHLIMCPEEFVRFTICHELAHLVNFDHSKDFYKTLKKFYPADEPEIEHWKYMPF